jgi:hypothetical protein
MNFLSNTYFVTASFYPASFYPSVAKAIAFQIPATQIFRTPYSYESRLFKRSQSGAEDDALYCCHGLNCNDLGDIHDGPGISGFVAHLMVGNMYHIRCSSVCGMKSSLVRAIRTG